MPEEGAIITDATARKRLIGSVVREFRATGNARGLAMVAADWAGYALCFTAICLVPWWPLKLLLAVVAGFFIARLFQLGHTASHGALLATGNKRWRRPLATLCLLPGLTPEHSWDYGHNRMHHVCINDKELDNSWVPMSPQEFRAAPAWRRGWERISRSLPGMGLHYMFNIWMGLLLKYGLKRLDRPEFRTDFACIILFLAAEIALAASLGGTPWQNLFFAILLPQLVWSYIMAMAVYFHHTHEGARWYRADGQQRPSLLESAYDDSRNVTLPWRMDLVVHSIMLHVIHHLSPVVPCYRQAEATRALEAALGEEIVTHRIGWREAWRITRHCQLYDFDAGCWRSYDWAMVQHAGDGASSNRQA